MPHVNFGLYLFRGNNTVCWCVQQYTVSREVNYYSTAISNYLLVMSVFLLLLFECYWLFLFIFSFRF